MVPTNSFMTKRSFYSKIIFFDKLNMMDDEVSVDCCGFPTDLLWTAPEVLRSVLKSAAPVMTKEADIYSLGIVLKQVLCKNSAYSDELVVYTSQGMSWSLSESVSVWTCAGRTNYCLNLTAVCRVQVVFFTLFYVLIICLIPCP